MSTALDLTDCITGIVTRPVGEYQEGKRRKAKAEELQNFVELRRRALLDTASDEASIKTRRSSNNQRVTKPSVSSGGKAAAASAKSIGSFAPRALKGMVVDIPLAITEGLGSAPELYGDKRRDNGTVTGIASGFEVAGKTFA